MAITFTNTLGGRASAFEPSRPPRVGIYVCGPTVYDVPHIGHARAAVVFDVLRRFLTWRGYDVLYVQNITDVDDKIINRANADGIDTALVAERFTRAYQDAMRSLNVLPPDIVPRASGHITEMVGLIDDLVRKDAAYPVDGSVYFSIERFDGYGKLSGNSLEKLRAGERVEPEAGVRSPFDFALWKAAKPGEPWWPSPWGPGRPGWHIECSAMARRYLGDSFDIHGGGADLVFPHHENEIAQSEAATGVEPFARWWLHNGHVQISGEKMSKSLRNYVVVDEVLADYPAQALRLFILSAHYRSPIAYGPEALDEAKAVWTRFQSFLRVAAPGGTSDASRLHVFGEAMDDDLNTPRAIAALHELVTEGHRLAESGDAAGAASVRSAVVEGLDVLGCAAREGASTAEASVGPLVEFLLELRAEARAARDFARADAIRDRLAEAGIKVEDSPQGARWYVA
jgi:cysteinyl-tRNA synthetase